MNTLITSLLATISDKFTSTPNPPPNQQLSDRQMLVTIGMEDYFHVNAFAGIFPSKHWSRFESRIEQNTRNTLDLLDQHGVHATFFVMGWVADQVPELVREVADRGHEVANQGYWHRTIRDMSSPNAFREDLLRSREALERAIGRRVVGHRVPHFLTRDTLWVLNILAEEGFAYDSSLRPLLWHFDHKHLFIHKHQYRDHCLTEVPISTIHKGNISLPLAAGNGFRQFPVFMIQQIVRWWYEHYDHPFVTYFHVWELDPKQPRIDASPYLTKLRHYRNLDKMQQILSHYLSTYKCMSIAHYLDLPIEHLPLPQVPHIQDCTDQCEHTGATIDTQHCEQSLTPVSIVIPCYNEAETLTYLKNTLEAVRRTLEQKWHLNFIFVDDGSKDNTVEELQRIFGELPGYSIILHGRNRGVSAAIMTGIRAANTEIVCSMDCDCTYDPIEFVQMIPKLAPDVAMVTASPYHKEGKVLHVPRWRLCLSRGASLLYQCVLAQDISTYTSCFRVYRRSKVCDIPLESEHFLGVAELFGKLILAGEKIVEHPATLESRIFGHSKMKALFTIPPHLSLMLRFGIQKLKQKFLPLGPAQK